VHIQNSIKVSEGEDKKVFLFKPEYFFFQFSDHTSGVNIAEVLKRGFENFKPHVFLIHINI
jgi:hypothetical protein